MTFLHRPIVWSALLALVVTLLMNSGSFVILLSGPHEALERKSAAIDEDFYISLVREAAEGHTQLGSASMKEHRDDRAVVTLLPLIPGMFIRVLHLPLWGALLFMDLLCPFLIAFFFALTLSAVTRDRFLVAAGTFFLLSLWSASLLNVINPKVVLVSAAAYLAVLFAMQPPRPWTFALRGSILSSLLYTYPHYFLYFAAFEGCDAVRRFLQAPHAIRKHTYDLLSLALPFFIIGLPKFLEVAHGVATPEGEDFWLRNVIESRFPSDPRMQVFLLIALFGLTILRRWTTEDKRTFSELLIVGCTAGLLVLNQQLVHGIEIMFGLHYRLLLSLLLYLATLVAILSLIRAISVQRIVIGILGIFSVFTMAQAFLSSYGHRIEIARAFDASDVPEVLAWLGEQEGERVILAPDEIGNVVPVFTHHYVVINNFSSYESVTDAELAKRYVLKELVEPIPMEERDRSYGYIFSVAAGNRAARARTACRIRSFMKKSIEECRVPVRDMILHQDVLRELEEDLAHRTPAMMLDLLRRFHVDFIIAKDALPAEIEAVCPEEHLIGSFRIHRCAFSLVPSPVPS